MFVYSSFVKWTINRFYTPLFFWGGNNLTNKFWGKYFKILKSLFLGGGGDNLTSKFWDK